MKMLKMNLTRWIILLISCYTTTTWPEIGMDYSFGNKGNAKLAQRIKGIDFQSDGKIILFSTEGLSRYNTDGSLDRIFGQNGIVLLRQPLTNDFKMSVKVQQPDNTITTVALKNPNAGSRTAEFHLKHYDENGLKITKRSDALLSWIRTHLTNTTTQIPLARNRILGIHHVAIQSDGKIIVVGERPRFFFGEYNNSCFIARYNPNRTLDSTFGPHRTGITGKEGHYFNAVTLQSDGKIIVAGKNTAHNSSNATITCYTHDGIRDPSFGQHGNGTNTYDDTIRITSITAHNDKLIVASYYDYNEREIWITQYNSNGTLDTNFASPLVRILTPPNYVFSSISIQPDGKMLVIYHQLHDQSSMITRLKTLSPAEATEQRRIAALEEAQFTRDQALKKQQDFELTVKKHADNRSNDCAICIQAHAENPTDAQLSCGHTFHASCLTGLQNPSCPLCRAPIFRGEIKMLTDREQEITQERAAIAEALAAAEARLVELEAVNSALEAERLLAAD